jgi:hypothetical protein
MRRRRRQTPGWPGPAERTWTATVTRHDGTTYTTTIHGPNVHAAEIHAAAVDPAIARVVARAEQPIR